MGAGTVPFLPRGFKKKYMIPRYHNRFVGRAHAHPGTMVMRCPLRRNGQVLDMSTIGFPTGKHSRCSVEAFPCRLGRRPCQSCCDMPLVMLSFRPCGAIDLRILAQRRHPPGQTNNANTAILLRGARRARDSLHARSGRPFSTPSISGLLHGPLHSVEASSRDEARGAGNQPDIRKGSGSGCRNGG